MTTTQFATSADGTQIAYESVGQGPAVLIVEGALCSRAMGGYKELAPQLAKTFTVTGYDRRGRGESGAGESAYEPQREVEDLIAVLEAIGPDVFVFSASSGAALALEAARQGVKIRALAAYEAPFIVDDTHAPNDADLPQQLEALIAQDRRGDAVKKFMKVVGAPAPMVAVMSLLPVWKNLKAVAHTLPYDLTMVVGFQQSKPLPDGYYSDVAVPTMVIAGGKSPEYMRNSQAAIAAQVPGGRLETLPGQTHMIRAKATVPALQEFFGHAG
ncbi:alpha/beta fold hydrolase [Nocardioides marmorisolisilvae]|uniref:Alpha/beta hydrolase n=1 Tax=Nocardioides marmorisolisilvae TaxID=1542737 RepID=A0A3N0DSN4_9ACTN|nr:alpha/beta hydrolase [Nocardioides marmorisolisilvae]RNL78521.1 alpha/beta hydrolase [Nocardioides marmorisolisilvae]